MNKGLVVGGVIGTLIIGAYVWTYFHNKSSEKKFNDNIQTRILEKDYYKTNLPYNN
jgi:hypothetical protein